MLSFLASSTEASLFSVTHIRIERMVEKKLPGALRLRKNKEHIQDSIIALVILNNVANIAGSVMAGNIAGELFDNFWLGMFTSVLTITIILFGEVVPKTLGERYADAYARRTAGFVSVLRVAFKPFILMVRVIIKPFGGTEAAFDRTSEEEITLLAHLGHTHGVILDSENQLIRRVFELNDILARDIMTPRTVVYALPAGQTLAESAESLHKTSVSRIPLFEDDLDAVVGVAHIRDLLAGLSKGQGERLLSDFADEPLLVPDTARADALLRTFQKNRAHLAIVIDEFGGTAGIISLEDILEQLVGEIVDEHDQDVDMRVKAKRLRERERKY
ncbi:MAG: HlyC/CorC family transporter [Ignavibacteria bacterium]|nr:HlyC/CorC family transporter [Ignavibacteria bacterium]